MKRFAFLSATGACICLSAASGLRAAEFGLDFLGLPDIIRGSPGEMKTVRGFVGLSYPIDAAAGVRGLSIGAQGEGPIDPGNFWVMCGFAVTAVLDDGDTIVDPYPCNPVGGSPWGYIFPGGPHCSGTEFQLPENVTLKPGGVQAIADLYIDVLVGDSESTLTINFLDHDVPDLGGRCSVTADGGVYYPTLASRTIQILPDTPPGGDFRLAFAAPGSQPPALGKTVIPIKTSPGEILIPVDVYVGTSGIQGPEGPQGWSIGISTANPGLSLVEATVEGILVPVVTPQGEKVVTLPPGSAWPASGAWPSPLPDRMQGAVTAVVLGAGQPMTLRPNVMDRVLRLVFKATVEDEDSIDYDVSFVDGLLTEGGESIDNVIAFNSGSHRPTIADDLRICINRFIESWSVFIRGDANGDAAVDISDAIKVLTVLFAGDPSGLACREAADANRDGYLDISDGVSILDNLFMGVDSIPAPYPECEWIGGSSTCPIDYDACP